VGKSGKSKFFYRALGVIIHVCGGGGGGGGEGGGGRRRDLLTLKSKG